jgi:hypothetical protein
MMLAFIAPQGNKLGNNQAIKTRQALPYFTPDLPGGRKDLPVWLLV